MPFEEIEIIFAVVSVLFSIIWVAFGYKGLGLGSKDLRIRQNSDSAKAIEILKERYAKGEIIKGQFKTMMRELQ